MLTSLNNALIRTDRICDLVPIASTLTNLVHIFEKCTFYCCCNSHSIKSNSYFLHIDKKSILRCVILLVPILGNILVGIYDLIENHPTDRNHSKSVGSVETVLSSKLDTIKRSFADFIIELENEIFPVYEKHEATFDNARIHGRMHIARAIIFSEVMGRYYEMKGKSVDFNFVRRATGLHDAGRKNNGEDLWENDSCELLRQHLITKNIPDREASEKSAIILKDGAHTNSIEFIIFQSADCLDIMRPCTGRGGRHGFDQNYLTFLKTPNSEERQFRENLIKEAWKFISITENDKFNFNESKGFMEKLFKIIRKQPQEFPSLFSIL